MTFAIAPVPMKPIASCDGVVARGPRAQIGEEAVLLHDGERRAIFCVHHH